MPRVENAVGGACTEIAVDVGVHHLVIGGAEGAVEGGVIGAADRQKVGSKSADAVLADVRDRLLERVAEQEDGVLLVDRHHVTVHPVLSTEDRK